MIEIIVLNNGIGRFVIRRIIISIEIVIAGLNRCAFIAVSVLNAGIFRVRFGVRVFFFGTKPFAKGIARPDTAGKSNGRTQTDQQTAVALFFVAGFLRLINAGCAAGQHCGTGQTHFGNTDMTGQQGSFGRRIQRLSGRSGFSSSDAQIADGTINGHTGAQACRSGIQTGQNRVFFVFLAEFSETGPLLFGLSHIFIGKGNDMLFNDICRINAHTQRAAHTGDKGHADCRRRFFGNQSRTADVSPGFGTEFLFASFIKFLNFSLKLLNNRQAADRFFDFFDFAVNTSGLNGHKSEHAFQTDVRFARFAAAFGIGKNVNFIFQNLLQMFAIAVVAAEINRVAGNNRINGRVNIEFQTLDVFLFGNLFGIEHFSFGSELGLLNKFGFYVMFDAFFVINVKNIQGSAVVREGLVIFVQRIDRGRQHFQLLHIFADVNAAKIVFVYVFGDVVFLDFGNRRPGSLFRFGSGISQNFHRFVTVFEPGDAFQRAIVHNAFFIQIFNLFRRQGNALETVFLLFRLFFGGGDNLFNFFVLGTLGNAGRNFKSFLTVAGQVIIFVKADFLGKLAQCTGVFQRHLGLKIRRAAGISRKLTSRIAADQTKQAGTVFVALQNGMHFHQLLNFSMPELTILAAS